MKQLLLAVAVGALLCCNNSEKKTATAHDVAAISNEEQYARSVNVGSMPDTVKKSVPRLATAVIDSNEISVNYFSPGVRGRMIWGGLVPYDQVWVTGAHSATKISFTKDLVIAGATVSAGTYAIFSIPGKNAWTFILNKNYQQHLADDYSQQDDIVRCSITPAITTDTVQRLTYTIKPHGQNTGSINISWEKIKLTIPFHSLQESSATSSSMITGKKLTGIKTGNRRDPVCYMPITAGITDTSTYRKKLYGFCSAECKRLFVDNPEQYRATLKE